MLELATAIMAWSTSDSSASQYVRPDFPLTASVNFFCGMSVCRPRLF